MIRSIITILLGSFIFNVCFAASPVPVYAPHMMVVSDHRLATKVGLTILKQGGNAIDAAVAMGYALAVVFPSSGNLGGGGFMMIHFAKPKRQVFINFRERSSSTASVNLLLDAEGKRDPQKAEHGYTPVAVPGTVMGLNTALDRYGTMTLERVIQPSIDLARKGFVLEDQDVQALESLKELLPADSHAAKVLFHHDRMYEIGDRFKQKELMHTLKIIRRDGTAGFYQGIIADRLVDAMQRHGGNITKKDLQAYRVSEIAPVTCHYHGYEVVTAPPPSAGGVGVCELLKLLEPFPVNKWGFHSAQSIQYMVNAMEVVFKDRVANFGDPVSCKVPIKSLLSETHLKKARESFSENPPAKKNDNEKTHEGTETTHFTVIDSAGNVVAVTYTLNELYGSRVMPEHLGFFLNNGLDDFSLGKNIPNGFGLMQCDHNLLLPNKQPISSMTPTIILKDGEFVMTLGARGGPSIVTSVFQVIQNFLDFHMDLQKAVDAPRIHMQAFPNTVFHEPFALSVDTQRILETKGYKFKEGWNHNRSHEWGAVLAIARDPKRPGYLGACDSRSTLGLAMGE